MPYFGKRKKIVLRFGNGLKDDRVKFSKRIHIINEGVFKQIGREADQRGDSEETRSACYLRLVY